MYVGDFIEDLKEGKGSFTWATGKTYEGAFIKDK
jgi:hypothetical protein